MDPPSASQSTKQKNVVVAAAAASVASPEETSEEESGSTEEGSDDFDSADDRVNQIFPSQSFLQRDDDESSDDEASGESHGTKPSVSDTLKQKKKNTTNNNHASNLEEDEEDDDDDEDDDVDDNDDEEEEEEEEQDDDDEEQDDDKDGSSSSDSEPVLSQLSKGSISNNGSAVQTQELKYVANKSQAVDANKSQAGDANKARVEDAKKARTEDAKKARSEDAKKARSEDAKKAQVEDTKKPPIEDSKKRKVEDAHSVKKSKNEVFKFLEKELNSTPVRTESRKEPFGGKDKEESDAQTEKIHKREESDDRQSVRKDELSFVKSGSKRSRDDELGEKSSSKRKRKESPAVGSEDTHEKHIHNEDRKVEKRDSVHLHHDAEKELARKSRANSVARGNGSMSDRKSSGADNEGLQENKANSHVVPSHTKLKRPHVWTVDEEIFLASEILNHLNLEHEIPSKRNAHFWAKLAENMNKKFIVEFTRVQLTEKVRRMKLRYQTTAQKVKECQELPMPYKHKTSSDQRLFDILSQIWGRSEITPLDDKEDVDPPVSLEVGEEILKPDMLAQSIQMDRDPKHAQDMTNIEIISKSQPDKGLNANGITDREAKPSLTTSILGNGSSPKVGSFDSLSMQKLIRDEIQTYVNEVKEWSKQSLEDWTNTGMMKIESSVKTLAEHSRHMIGMENGSTVLPGGVFSRSMHDLQTFGGEEAFKQQWKEIQMQQWDIYDRKLQIMKEECELKQKMLNLYPRPKKKES